MASTYKADIKLSITPIEKVEFTDTANTKNIINSKIQKVVSRSLSIPEDFTASDQSSVAFVEDYQISEESAMTITSLLSIDEYYLDYAYILIVLKGKGTNTNTYAKLYNYYNTHPVSEFRNIGDIALVKSPSYSTNLAIQAKNGDITIDCYAFLSPQNVV